ncbi:MAG: hypothetical protein GXO74_14005 [Calditrichaeota bacterium]|nr:hypothetical protein [Calditrichota bacterium]
MKKRYLNLTLTLLFIFSISLWGQTRTWKDGTPFFVHIDSLENAQIGSTVTLNPLYGSSSQPAGFQFSLSGQDWLWPSKIKVESAEDIDARLFLGSELYLVTDGAGKQVLEINPTTGSLIWEFSGESVNDPRYLAFPVDACSYTEMEGTDNVRKVLITDQGRHRVIKVIQATKDIQWSYGHADVEGTAAGYLSSPADAVPMPDSGKIFICDKGNNRVILVNEADSTIEWKYNSGLNNPVDIDYSEAQNAVLITDQSNHRVILVSLDTNGIIWSFGTSNGTPDSLSKGLNLPADADFLDNGNILIADAGNHRLIEVNNAGQVVWEFGKRFDNLKDADRLPDNKHLIVDGNLPERIGYATSEFVSDPRDIGKEVSFTNLIWNADTMATVTSVKLQLRSANTLGDLESAPWHGPSEADSFYVSPSTAINSAHNGHRFYQFKAKLITQNPLYTPTLNDVILNYFYYDVNTTGRITTTVIQDSADNIITRWSKLIFKTVLPENTANRNKVELKITIKDAYSHSPIRSFTASNVDTSNEEALSNVVQLEKKQAIYLQATFKTNNSSVSPALDSWQLEWESTSSSPSEIQFVDPNFQPVTSYRFSDRIQPGQPYIDRVTVLLNDANLEQVSDLISVRINSLLSHDSEEITLNRQTNGGFLLQPSIPGIILSIGVPATDNGFLEVFDRDTLVVNYTDPTNSDDQSGDSVLVIEDKSGVITFLNQYFAPIDTATVGDTIFVRITGENDRNISFAQDTIYATVFDYKTSDQEKITLVEQPDSLNVYFTGNFLSTRGLPIILKNVRTTDDGNIQTISGSQIGIEYLDTISDVPILEVATGSAAPDTLWNYNSSALEFDFAPQPYRPKDGDALRIRIVSSIGTLAIDKIEIFTLSGAKIREILSGQLSFYYNYPIPKHQYGLADNWWNLKNANGDLVSSGTYFVKVSGHIVESGARLSSIRKLVVIR